MPKPIVPLMIKKVFEDKQSPLATTPVFISRVFLFITVAIFLTSLVLIIGMIGYRYYVDRTWIDAFVDSSMTLAGMGEVDIPTTVGGKIFSCIYSLFCGLLFSVIISLLLAPFVHRLYHKFHLDHDVD